MILRRRRILLRMYGPCMIIFRPHGLVHIFRELQLCAFMFDLNVLLTVILA